jgi:ribosomal protein S18 acetylase RimI-like enzyme
MEVCVQDLRVVPYESRYFNQALCLDGRASKRREQKLKMLELKDVFYGYVAISGGDVLGFIIMEDMGDGKSHYMVQINVKEKRRGVGRALVREVFSRIGSGGHVSLCVNTDNEAAIRFYESFGFCRSGYTEDYKKGQNKFWYAMDL